MCDARDLRLLFNFQVSIARTTNLTHTTRRTSLVKETLSRFSTTNNACQNADLLCNIGSKLISKHLRDKRYTCRSRDSVILRSKSQFGAPIALLHFETPRESKHNIVTICVSIFVAPKQRAHGSNNLRGKLPLRRNPLQSNPRGCSGARGHRKSEPM
jgi:hypothetical protein